MSKDKWHFGKNDDDGEGEGGRKDKKFRSGKPGKGRFGNENKMHKGGKGGEKNRPGKVKRMMQRNKKNSFNNKKKGK